MRVDTEESGEGQGTPSPRVRRRRLSGLRNVRTALADALCALEAGQMDPGKARVLIYGYSVLAGVIHQTDVEGRITSLEDLLRDGGRG